MEPIKSRFPDQVFLRRRKVNSCFSFGVLVCVIVSAVVLINFSLKAPINHQMFQGFSNITSNSFVSTSTSDTSRTRNNNSSGSAKSDDFLVSNDEEVDLKNTYLEKKFPENKNRSFSLEEGYVGNRTHKAIVFKVVKNGNFTVYSGQDMVSEKTHHWKNLSEAVKNGSFPGVEGSLTEKIQQEVFSHVDTSSKNFPQENEEVKTAEKFRNESFEGCDIFSGRWVRDDSKPYFPPGSCPHIDKSFDCHLNGRPDDGFLKWKWQPNGCDIPRVDYFQEGNYVHPRLMLMEAYKRALATWARWVDKNIDSKRTQVFFRGHSGTHFSGGAWNSGGRCSKEVDPIFNESYLAKYPIKMRALQNVLQYMKTPVTYLNISRLTDYRKDGHPSIYRRDYINKTTEEKQKSGHQDCSHWCLPGVPDTWNELFYVSLLKSGKGSWRS